MNVDKDDVWHCRDFNSNIEYIMSMGSTPVKSLCGIDVTHKLWHVPLTFARKENKCPDCENHPDYPLELLASM